tara:strand:+ start:50873 stop:51889 length:1017 start_codon:yes stop_codon:yes gene_type:complete
LLNATASAQEEEVVAVAVQLAEAIAPMVSANSAGLIKLGMTIAEAREAMNEASFKRSSEGEGIALVTISVNEKTIMRLSAVEENAESTVAGDAVIDFIDVMDTGYKTKDGVHPGISLEDAEKVYGKASELVMSELEAREYVTFPNQPSGLYFRLSNKNGSAGIYKAGEMVTTSYRPGSEIAVIEVTGADIMVDARIGGLGLDASEVEVLALGEKEKLGALAKGKDEIWEAFGEAVQPWTFTGSGCSADMISGEIGGTKAVFSITIEAPSELKTERGIGIGSTKEEVVQAYADYKTEKEEAEHLAQGGDKYLVGSIYGGMIFEFKAGKVSRIFLGAAAE